MSDQGDVGGALFDDEKRREVERERALARVLSDLDSRIADVAGRLDGVQEQFGRHLPLVANGLGELRTEVRALSDRAEDPTTLAVDAVRDELIQVTGRLAGLERQLGDASSLPASRLEGIERSLAHLAEAPLLDRMDDLHQRVTELDEDVRRDADRDPLDPETRHAVQEALRASGHVLTREDLAQAMQAVSRRLDEVAEVASTTDAGPVHRVEERLDALQAAQAELASAFRETTTTPVVAGMSDDVRDELTQLRASVESAVAQSGASQGSVGDELVRQRLDVLARVLEEQEARQESTDDAVREGLLALAARVDEVRSRTSEIDQRLSHQGTDAFERRMQEVVDTALESGLAPAAEQQRHLTALVDGLAASLDAETSALRDQSAAVRAAVTEALGEQSDQQTLQLRSLLERLESVLSGHQERLTGLADGVEGATGSVQELVDELRGEVEGVRGLLSTTATQTEDRVADLRQLVASLAESGEQQVADVGRVVDERIRELGGDVRRDLSEGVQEVAVSVQQVVAELRGEVDGVRGLMTTSTDETEGRVAELRRLVSTLTESGEQQVADVGRVVDERIRELGGDVRRDLSEGVQEVAVSVQQVVAELRGEVEGVRGLVASSAEQSEGQVTELRQLVSTMTESGEQQVADVGRVVDERISELGGDVRRDLSEGVQEVAASVQQVVAELRGEVEGVRGLVASSTDETEGRVTELRRLVSTLTESGEQQVADVGRVVDERISELGGDVRRDLSEGVQEVAASVQQVVAELRGEVEGVRGLVASSTDETEGRVTELRRLVSTLTESGEQQVAEQAESRTEVLETVRSLVDAVTRAQEQHAADLRGALETTREQTDQQVVDLRTLVAQQAAEVSERVQTSVASTESVAEQTLVAVTAHLEAMQSSLDERAATLQDTQRDLTAMLQDTRRDAVAQADGIRVALADAQAIEGQRADESRSDLVDRLDAVVARTSEAQDALVARLAGEVETSSSAADERTDAALARLGELVEELSRSVSERLGSTETQLREHVTTTADEQAERVAAAVRDVQGLIDGASSSHAEHVSMVDTALEDLRSHADELTASLRTTVERTDVEGVRLRDDLDRHASERDAHLARVQELLAQAEQAMHARAAGIEEQVAQSLDRMGEEILASVDVQLMGDLEARVNVFAQALAAERAAEEERVIEIQDQLLRSAATIGLGLDGVVEDVAIQLTETRSGFQAALAAQAGRIQQLLGDAAGRLDDRGSEIAERADQLSAIAEGVVGPLRELSDSTTTTSSSVADLASRAEGQERRFSDVAEELAAMRARLDTELDALRTQSDSVTSGIAETLASDRDAVRADLEGVVREAGNELTRAQVALTRGADVMRETAKAQEEQAATAVASAAERAATSFEERVDAAWREAAATFLEQTSAAAEHLETRLAELQREAESRHEDMSTTLRERTDEAVSSLTADLRGAREELGETVGGLDRLEGALVAYLAQRDAQLVADRDALVRDLVEQFAGGMSDRQRRRLAGRLEPSTRETEVEPAVETLRRVVDHGTDVDEVPQWDGVERRSDRLAAAGGDVEPPPAPTSATTKTGPGAAPTKSASASRTKPRRTTSTKKKASATKAASSRTAPTKAKAASSRKTASKRASTSKSASASRKTASKRTASKTTTSKTATKKAASERASTSKSASTSRKAASKKAASRKATSSQTPLEVLEAVNGLGTAKATALLDRFGSVDAVAAASDDELLAVSGIGPAVLRAIRTTLKA